MNVINTDVSALAPFLPLLIPAGALMLLLSIWCIVDIIRRPRVALLPTWVWVPLVLLALPWGAILYLAIGRGAASGTLREEDLR